MKLKALIIDDEPLAHDVILNYAKDIPFLEIVGQCYLATEAISFLNQNSIDLLFLDIQMPKLKGTDFLRTLQNKPGVIITSAYENYAIEGFELEVNDYLLKPFPFDRFLRAVNNVYSQTLQKRKINNSTLDHVSTPVNTVNEKTIEEHLIIKVDKRQIQLKLDSIWLIESYGNYVKVWLEDEFHLTPRTLSSFEEQLPKNNFIRTHKSFIVNKSKIDFIEGNRIMLLNQKELPVGKNYKDTIRNIFHS